MATNTKNVLFTKAEADCPLGRGNAAARRHFWCSIGSYFKPALKGEVDMSVSEWTEGLKKKDVSLIYVNPSVKPSV